jgi:hypothetical protein
LCSIEVAIFDEQLRSRFDWLREPDPAAPCYAPAMVRPKRPVDFAQRAKLIVDMIKSPIPA